MQSIEFYMTPKGEVMLREEGKLEKELKEQDYDFISAFLKVLEEFYPDAHKKLMEEYARSEKNKTYRNFLAVRRFIKCNLGNYDNVIDVDQEWNFKFEFVGCPLRGECRGEKVICNPRFESNLSPRQNDVMKMCCEGKSDEEIAENLFITLDTVKNHRKNSFRKIGIHSIAEFMRYAQKNNLFNQ